MKHISPFFCLKEIHEFWLSYMYCSKQLRPSWRIFLHIWSCLPLKAQGSWSRNKNYNFGQNLAQFWNNLMSSLSHWFPATLSAAICQSDAPVLRHSAFLFFITFPCSLYIVQWTLSMCTIVHVYTIVYTLQNAPIPWHSKDCWHKKAHKLKSDHNVPQLLDFAGDSVYWLLQPLTVDIVTLSRIT